MYEKTLWVDQDVERPKTFDFSQNEDGSYLLLDSFGEVIDLGTPVNAQNMNHIEDGIYNNAQDIALIQTTLNQKADKTEILGPWIPTPEEGSNPVGPTVIVDRKTNMANGTVSEYDLSAILPNDEYNYECIFRTYTRSSNSSFAGMDLYTSVLPLWISACWQSGTPALSNNICVLPIGTDRKLYATTVGTPNSWFIGLAGYRRMGSV